MENEKKSMQDWTHLRCVEDFNKFIEENKISNPGEFRRKFKSGYNKACILGLLKDLVYETRTNNWSHLNTPDDFNKFIKENDIKNPKDFAKRFIGGYVRASKLNILDKLIYPERKNNWSHLNTPDDFNKFIEENDIKSSRDLIRRFGGVYNKANKLGVLKDLKYKKD